MQYVPQPTLGAIVIAAALSLADIRGTRRLWQQQRVEFCCRSSRCSAWPCSVFSRAFSLPWRCPF